MRALSISEVAEQFGMRSSALRYYEKIGLLPAAYRVSGQRRYDVTILRRLAVVQRAREVGFSLEEIRELLTGFGAATSASQRWRELSQRKVADLDAATERIRVMMALLERMGRCSCNALDQCGERLLQKASERGAAETPPPPRGPGNASCGPLPGA